MKKASPLMQNPQQAIVDITLIMLVAATAIVILAQYTDLDQIIANYYFDPVRMIFPWDNTWFGKRLMHGYVKNVIVWFGLLLIIVTVFDLVRPLRRFTPLRYLTPLGRLKLRFLTLAAVLEPKLILSLKEASNMHCPWGVDLYGGKAPMLRLLDWVPEGWEAGRCFPAGHASAGMWLSALAILWLPTHPRKALATFVAGLSVGLFMGWVQQMRGQHFLSHTLATAWLSTALLLFMLAVFWRPMQRALIRDSDANSNENTPALVWQQ